MLQINCKEASSVKSGVLFFTDEYLVIQGKHFNVCGWSVRQETNNVAIPMRDILGMDFINMRSKTLLMIFIILTSALAMLGKSLLRRSKVILVLLILCCLTSLLCYLFKEYRFFRVTAMGYMVAVETKHYDINKLHYLISCWDVIRTAG